jgi:glycosyltransferase involved in cell wall biosynthesis
MDFSLVIPTLQSDQFLEKTLESVISQKEVELEVIVQDGGSKDNTLNILRKYSDQIILESSPDGGQAAAINKGLRKAKGEIVGYLNSDDVLTSNALLKVISYFQKNPQANVVYGLADMIDATDKTIGIYPVEKWNYERLQETCFICQPACFWRRSVLSDFGFFDESLHFAFDYDFWLRVGRKLSFDFIPEKLALARKHPQAKTVSKRRESFEEAFQVVCHHSPDHIPRRWILALAQARAERCLQNKVLSPLCWFKFIREYYRQAKVLAKTHHFSSDLKLISSILPHCLSAYKRVFATYSE